MNHVSGDNQLVVDAPSIFGSPSSSSPVKVVAAGIVFGVTSVSGSTLTVSGVLEGTSDANIPSGTIVEVQITARDVSDLQDAVAVLDTYTHTQASPASTWTITHNLGRFPSVTVVDSAGTLVMGDVTYTNSNSLQVGFTASFSGKAYLN